jgi:hypothetical protein
VAYLRIHSQILEEEDFCLFSSESLMVLQKSLEENVGGKLFDIDLSNDFLYVTPKAWPTEQR